MSDNLLAGLARLAAMPELVSFEEFKRLDIRVGRVKSAEKIPGAKRLLLLRVDVGGEERQVVAGLAEYFEPEELVGKSIVVVVNLVPKVIRGYKSEAMLLAAVCDGRPVLIVPEEEVPPGTPVE